MERGHSHGEGQCHGVTRPERGNKRFKGDGSDFSVCVSVCFSFLTWVSIYVGDQLTGERKTESMQIVNSRS